LAFGLNPFFSPLNLLKPVAENRHVLIEWGKKLAELRRALLRQRQGCAAIRLLLAHRPSSVVYAVSYEARKFGVR
jgi:hypothetical protein